MHSINKMFSNQGCYLLICMGVLLGSCKKMIEIDLPIDKNTSETIYAGTNTAVSAMTGIYAMMAASGGMLTNMNGLSIRNALRVDELTPVNPQAFPDYLNVYNGNTGWSLWSFAYRQYIYRINSLIEGVAKSSTLPGNSKIILTAEAKFTRAWLYFYLVNFYGDVPLVITADLDVNKSIGRTSKEQVYEQIVQDLKDAQAGLATDFLDKDLISSTSERIRPNKSAATALLARVFLYLERWQEAENEATKVIDDPDYQLLDDLNGVFLKNSREAIWQWQPNILDPEGANAPDGRYLVNPYGGDPFFYVSQELETAFEDNDNRKNAWLTTRPNGSIVPYKYKQEWAVMDQTEYTTVLRLAEQYLIRAESRARLNKLQGINGAEADLNIIRLRAGLPATTAASQADLLNAISKERQVELFLEWGDRWLNLKRLGELDNVMKIVAPKKGADWAPYKALLPIPYEEFTTNPTLRGHQNPGYAEQP